jgi:hypothetical protein
VFEAPRKEERGENWEKINPGNIEKSPFKICPPYILVTLLT